MAGNRLTALLTIAIAVAACGVHGAATRTVGTAEDAASITDTAQAEQFGKSRQRLDGNVGTVDPSTGTITVRTAAGDLTLHYPPESLGGMRSGEPVVVEYAIAKGRATTWAYNAPAGARAQRVYATVEEANHTTGWVRVRWDAGMLNLVFLPTAIQNLNPGDPVTVDLAFSKMLSPR
jgi:hypothetical protein